MIDRLYNAAQGGLLEDESILVRSQAYYDGAEPSGHSVAALDLVRLHVITGESHYGTVADRSLRYFGELLQRGSAAPLMLTADSAPDKRHHDCKHKRNA